MRTRARPDFDPLGIDFGLLYSNLGGGPESTVGRFISSLRRLSPKVEPLAARVTGVYRLSLGVPLILPVIRW